MRISTRYKTELSFLSLLSSINSMTFIRFDWMQKRNAHLFSVWRKIRRARKRAVRFRCSLFDEFHLFLCDGFIQLIWSQRHRRLNSNENHLPIHLSGQHRKAIVWLSISPNEFNHQDLLPSLIICVKLRFIRNTYAIVLPRLFWLSTLIIEQICLSLHLGL